MYLREILFKQRGFTMIELVVSFTIFIIITGIVIANFSTGKKSDILRMAADTMRSNVRKVQNMTMTGIAQPDGSPMPIGGYGIYILSNTAYTIFADENNDKLRSEEEDIEIINLSYNLEFNEDCVDTNIIFIPPKPVVCVDGECIAMEVTIIIKHIVLNESRILKFNTVSSQISIEK